MKQKVLVVEDFEDSRAMMRLLIEREGYTVIEAAGAYEAIAKAEELRPDLILMDIGLPLLDGLSTTERIREIRGLENIPIIAVTGFSDIGEQATKAGCDGVIYKPIEPSDLQALLISTFAETRTVNRTVF